MKKVLSLLVSFVVLQTQSWALSGGPVYSNDVASFTGTYAGVLVPKSTTTATSSTVVTANELAPSASIGLFSLIQGSTGFASGTIVAFVNGAVFNGTIQGIIDPDGGTLNGVIDATSAFKVTQLVPTSADPTTGVVTYTTQDFDVSAEGNINASIENASDNGAATRITGSASLDIFFNISQDGTPIINQNAVFEVDGFKQADAATTTGS